VDPAAGKITFSTFSETWLEGLDLKPATHANYVSNLKSRQLPTFGNAQLAKITSAQVRVWQARLRDDGLSAASVRQTRQVLSAAFDVAVADGLIVRNPAAVVKPPKVRPRRQQFLTAEQVEELAAVCDDRQPCAGAVVLLLGMVGTSVGRSSRAPLGDRKIRSNALFGVDFILEVGCSRRVDSLRYLESDAFGVDFPDQAGTTAK